MIMNARFFLSLDKIILRSETGLVTMNNLKQKFWKSVHKSLSNGLWSPPENELQSVSYIPWISTKPTYLSLGPVMVI